MTETTPEERPIRDLRPWYRRWVPGWRTITVLAFLFLATPALIRWYRLSWMPDVPVPFDEVAFNETPAAVIGNEDHAFTHFQKAVYQDYIQPKPAKWSEFWEWFSEQPDTVSWDDLPEDVRDWVVRQQPALEHFRRGGRCEIGQVHLPKTYNFMLVLGLQQEIRGLERLSQLETLRLLHEGNTKEAADHLHDTYRAHRMLGQRGCFIERLIGVACHAMMMKSWQAWSQHPRVTVDDLEAALARLRQDWKLTPPVSDSFKVEYFSLTNELKYPMTTILDEFDQSVDRWTIEKTGMSSVPLTKSLAKGWQIPVLWVAGEPERSNRAARLWLTHQLKTCDLPRSQQPSTETGLLELANTPELTAGLTAAQLDDRLRSTLIVNVLPASHQVVRATWAEAGKQTLLELALQLQILIRQQNLTTRESLETALDNYVWPIDPCAPDGTPIRFRFTDEGLKLWSLSWDGLDQGGTTEMPDKGKDSVVLIPWPATQP